MTKLMGTTIFTVHVCSFTEEVACLTGLEPVTYGLEDRHSFQLSYRQV